MNWKEQCYYCGNPLSILSVEADPNTLCDKHEYKAGGMDEMNDITTEELNH